MAEHTVHIRLDSTYYDTLQRMRERERFPPSINAIATALLKSGIDAADGSADALRALASAVPQKEEAGPRRNAIYPAPAPERVIPCGAVNPDDPDVVCGKPSGHADTHGRAETARDRFKRLLASSATTEAALVRELGLTSRGKLQHALRRGEVPPEVEAWMRQQEGGGR